MQPRRALKYLRHRSADEFGVGHEALQPPPGRIVLRNLIGGPALAVLVVLLAAASVAHAQIPPSAGDAGSVPSTPDQPSGSALWAGIVDIHWDEVAGADSYDVQYFHILEMGGPAGSRSTISTLT